MVAKTPPLGSVRAFDAAARNLSFTRAAAELGITQAAVSWQIKALEQRLGVQLFDRGRAGLALTVKGKELAPGVTDALARLAAAFEAIAPAARHSETLRVSVAPTFANMWLVPRLNRFRTEHPGIAIDIDATGELVDIAGGAADVVVRHGVGPWPGLVRHQLLPVILMPACSPELVDGATLPLSVESIARLPLLQPLHLVKPWFDHMGVTGLSGTVRNSATYHQEHMAASAAMAGQGVAFVNPHFWPEAFADSRLMQISPALVVPDNDGYWLAYKDRPSAPRAIRLFRDWILAEMRNALAQGGGHNAS
jgi:LysR family transcriptional regulator, glycine cleavage system transcriptional activator